MATYCPYLSNQAEVISSPYLRDQMYLPDQSLTTSYTSLLSTESLQCPPDGQRNEIEFISQMGNSPHFEQSEGEQNRTSQGLSLSLRTQFPPQIGMPVYQYQFAGPDSSHLLSPHVQVEYDFEAYKLLGPMPMIYNSKYMKVAQELLEEVVSVRKTIKQPETEKQKKANKFELFRLKDVEMGSSSDACDSSTKGTSEFSPQGKKQLKEKLANLNSLVDEVDGRYRKYCHQMRTVVSSFEMVAGHGAARSYTALALCTISRQFKCLHNAINEQILVIRQSLGEKDATPSVEGKLTRLRIVDQRLRQQMTLQQVGVMRNSGRPQRGLPGNSVSILRAWLFEHFLHPYPKDSEKIMLSRQTGLTRGQVANWFINARVRLWKPMVEEMYKEEFGDTDSSFSPDPSPRTPKTNKQWTLLDETREDSKDIVTLTIAGDDSKPTLIPGFGLKGCTARLGFQNGPLEQIDIDCETMPPKQTGNGSSLNFPTTFAFPEMGNFSVAKQVSLALGVEQGNNSLLIASREMQFRDNYEQGYDCVNQLNQHPINDPNLLPDFVS